MRRYAGTVLEGLDRIFKRGTVAGLSEGGLLERFVAGRDEAAFAALVGRHGPMVLGVCRRALRDEHDVEDAFQATFLVLVRRAGSIRDADLVGHWLHGVAHRVAVRARANAARRRVREQTGVEVDRAEERSLPFDDAPAVLDEELARLPESLRAPLVLCYLEGLTHDEAASRLGWPVGTVRSRMSRARALLERRLTRRGVSVAGAALPPLLSPPSVSSSLLLATVRTALGTAIPKTTATLLAQGALNAMMISKMKTLVAIALVGALTLGGVRTFARQLGAAKPVEAPAQTTNRKDTLTVDLAKIQAKEEALKASLAYAGAKKQALQAEENALIASLAAVTARKEALQKELTDLSRPVPPQVAPKEANSTDPSKAKRPVPLITRWGNFMVATTPEGDRAALYSSETGLSKVVRLSGSKENRHVITPFFYNEIMALQITGPKITRIALFNFKDNSWHIQDLREPVTSASPTPIHNMRANGITIIYPLGHYFYTFSPPTKTWDTLELAEGAKPKIAAGAGVTPSFEYDGHIYTFSEKDWKWTDFDTRSILDTPEDKDAGLPKK